MLNLRTLSTLGLALLTVCAQGAVAQGTWKQIGSMKSSRNAFPTALSASNNNLVFMLGGRNSASGFTTSTTEDVTATATNPVFTKTSNLVYSRSYMPAVPIQGTSKVLLPGGFSAMYGTLRTAELFDTATKTSKSTGNMSYGREQYDAVQLSPPASGGFAPVLAIGGFNGNYNTAYGSCELYNYSTGRWTATASLTTPRFGTTSLVLPDGRVMAVGGRTEPGDASLSTIEYYTPVIGSTPASWVQSPAPTGLPVSDGDWTPFLHYARFRHTMTVIGSDAAGYPILLITGGYSGNGAAGRTLPTAEIGVYNASSTQYSFQVLCTADATTGRRTQEQVQMLFVNAGRMDHTATLISGLAGPVTTSQVFVVGGWDGITNGPGATIALPELITVSLSNGEFTGSSTHLVAPTGFSTRHEQAAVPVTIGASHGALICGGLQVDSYGNTCLNDAWIFTAP